MATYVVGDIQGCYDPLMRLLEQLHFSPERDTLWAVGDLVNRGAHSLEVLRFLESLGDSFVGVLGNHDLHFLAVALETRAPRKKDTLTPVLEAPDLDRHVAFLRALPLVHYGQGVLMVHAGIPPQWTLEQALEKGQELSDYFMTTDATEFFTHMYGDTPARFTEDLRGIERARTLTNIFTRMRFCTWDGTMDLEEKGNVDCAPQGMKAWFAFAHRPLKNTKVVFGHWAALGGVAKGGVNVEALDTGCVWGRRLTALHLETGKRYSVPAKGNGTVAK